MIRKLILLCAVSAAVLNAQKFTTTDQAEVVTPPRSSSASTALLFPYAINQAGYDTQITLSNTSQDPFGSTAGSGVCTLYFYGSGAPVSQPQTSAAIPAGQQIVFNLSAGGGGLAGAPGFEGYIVANCAFPLARGLATVFGLVSAAHGPVFSQDAQVLTLPRGASQPQYLLFPYVANQNGFDTGIIISNTSLDPFGTSPSSGSCMLNFYGANAPAAFSTAAIPAGSQYLILTSEVAPNFQGYMVADCNFPDAAGTGFYGIAGDIFWAANPELLTTPRATGPSQLLFFPTNQNGMDTLITIANTSQDPIGTASSSGTCTLTFYNGSTAPAPFTTPAIAAGQIFVSPLSLIAPGFAGYMTAACQFPQARGTALVGNTGFTQSYNSTPVYPVTLPRSTAAGDLLFQAVTSAGGTDTSIFLLNTSADPFGSTAGSGTCTISYYGAGAPAPQVTPSIPAGGGFSWDVGGGNASAGIAAAPGFSGYIALACGFPLARGFASISQYSAALSIASTHTGNFTQGQAGATYTVTVSNAAGAGTTDGTITVTETVPSGLALISMSGTGWTCAGGATTCTRSDPLAGGASYPPITVTVNVAGNASSPQVNSVAVSAESAPGASGMDSTTINTLPAGSVTEYPIPTANSQPYTIAPGPDGALWFTEYTTGKIGRISTAGVITEFIVPTPNSGPRGIVAGPDGLIWFTEWSSGKIGKLTTGGVFTEYTLPDLEATPAEIVAGPDGALWFTDIGGRIGRIPTSGPAVEYPTPTSSSGPYALCVGPDENLWFSENFTGSVGKVTTSGSFTEYPTAFGSSSADSFSCTAGPDGAVWFAANNTDRIVRFTTSGSPTPYNTYSDYIIAGPGGALWFTGNGIESITTGGSITPYPIGAASAGSLALGSDGAIWFTDLTNNKIGRFVVTASVPPQLSISSSHTGNFTQAQQGATYTVTVSNAAGAQTTSGTVTVTETVPSGLALVSMSGTGWTCVSGATTCTRSDPLAGGASYAAITVTVNVAGNASSPQVNSVAVSVGGSTSAGATDSTVINVLAAGTITEIAVPTASALLRGITAGPDGNLWFAEDAGNKIGRITTAGVITEFPVTTSGANPENLTNGPDGALWFTEYGAGSGAGKVGRITTLGSVTEFPAPTAHSSPFGIATGSDGNLWFTEYAVGNIAKMTTSGAATEIPIPTSGSKPPNVTVGPDGALWFTEQFGNKIGRISTAGVVTEFPVPTADSLPWGIVAGPDGNLWFTESTTSTNQVGRITTSGTVTEFPLLTSGAGPLNMTAGPDGALWFTESGGDKIGRITTTGMVSEFPIPTGGSQPVGIVAGPDAGIWFTEGQGNKIGRIATGLNATPVLSITSAHSGNFTQGQTGATYTLTVSNSGGLNLGPITVTENLPSGMALVSMSGQTWTCNGNTCTNSTNLANGASLPAITVTVNVAGNAGSPQVNVPTVYGGGSSLAFASDSTIVATQPEGGFSEYPVITSNSQPDGITVGPDGALWFAERLGGKIGRMTTGGIVSEYPTLTANSLPASIAAGPDGALWFTENAASGNQIGRITTSGTVTEYPIPTANASLFAITAGPDGNLWFTEGNGNNIGRITTAGVVTEFPVPTAGSRPGGIAVGPDGALWFPEMQGNQIGRITTAGAITEFPVITASSGPSKIVAGPDGSLWFTEQTANQIGRITVSGSVTEFSIPTAGSYPSGIAMGPNDAVWFVEAVGNKIAWISEGGSVSEYPVPTSGSGPVAIVAGPDSGMWFTEETGNKIGRVSTGLNATQVLSITSIHSGNFTQGQTGATYTLTVSNSGGLTLGNVNVMENPPSGMALVSMSGQTWTCTGNTCTNSTNLAHGASLPAITVTVNVAGSASSPQVNVATVYGGGSSLAFASDSTVVGAETVGTITLYPLLSPTSSVRDLTTGPDRAIWFTDPGLNEIGRMTVSGSITEYPAPTASASPAGIVTGADGQLWFAENSSASKIGEVTTSGVFTEYPLGGGVPLYMTEGPDGAVWFGEQPSNQIGRITTSGGLTQYSPLSASAGPDHFTLGSDGALWFAENGATANKIGRITLSGVVSEFSIPTAGAGPIGIAAGPDGNLWFTEGAKDQIGKLTPTGTFTEYPIPTAGATPAGIQAGPDGAMWFAESHGGQIGRITTAGMVVEYSVPNTGAGGLNNITAGPDGGMWFNNPANNSIGRIATGLTATPALSITVTDSGNFVAGQQGTYSLTVSNMGTGATNGTVVVPENLPFGLTVAGANGTGWTCTTGGCYRTDSLAAGASYPPITVTVNVAAGTASPLVNVVTVYGGGSQIAGAVDSTAVGTGTAPVLSITKTHTGNFTAGQQGAIFTISVSNAAGAGPTNGSIAVADAPPPGMTLVNMAGSGWNCANSACVRGDTLAAGSSYPPITVTVNVASNAVGALTNTAALAGGGQDGTPEVEDTVTIGAPFSLGCTTLAFDALAGAPLLSQACTVGNPNNLSLSASAQTASGGNWLSASLSGVLTVTATPGSLAAGTYTGAVTVSAAGGGSASIPVTLIVTAPLTIAPSANTNVPAAGVTNATFSVNATGPWAVVNTNPWITIVSPAIDASGNNCSTGSGTVTYTVSPNTSANQKNGTFTILSGCPTTSANAFAVATFTIGQAAQATCNTTAVFPASQPTSLAYSFSGTGGTPTTVQLNNACSSPVSQESWIVIQPGGTASSFSFTVAPYNGTTPQTGSILVGTQSLTITQNPLTCSYSVATTAGFSPIFPAAGGTGSLNIGTSPAAASCAWTAAPSNTAMITQLSASGGTGPATVTFTVAPNTQTTAQSASILVEGVKYAVTQAAASPLQPTYACTVTADPSRTLRAESETELVADLVLACSGTSVGGVMGDVIVNLSSNTTITNHALTTDPSHATTDALLLNVDAANPTWTLGPTNPNAWRGLIAGPRSLRFPSVNLAPDTGPFSHSFRITNVRVDASRAVSLANGTSSPPVVTATIAIQPPLALPTVGAPFTYPTTAMTVGSVPANGSTIQASSSFAAGTLTAGGPGGSGYWPLTFTEQQAHAYLPSLASGQAPVSTPGVQYVSEIGFVDAAAFGAETGYSNNGRWTSSNAAMGTRLMATIANVPCSVSLYAPVDANSGGAAQLVSADGTGSFGFPVVSSAAINGVNVDGYQLLPLTPSGGATTCPSTAGASGIGSATITWEVTSALANSPSALTFNLAVYNPGNVSLSGVTFTGGPGPQVTLSATSATAPVPRFNTFQSVTSGSTPTKLSFFFVPTGSTSSGNPTTAQVLAAKLPVAAGGSRKLVPETTAGGSQCSQTATATITNTGTTAAANTIATIQGSGPLSGCFGPSGSQAAYSGSTCTVNLSSAPAAGVYQIAVTSTACTPFSYSGYATSGQGNSDPNSSDQASPAAPIVNLYTLQTPTAFAQGDLSGDDTLTVSVINTGDDAPAGSISVVQTLPPNSGLVLKGYSTPAGDPYSQYWVCTTTATTATCTYGINPNLTPSQEPLLNSSKLPLGSTRFILSFETTATAGVNVTDALQLNTDVGGNLYGTAYTPTIAVAGSLQITAPTPGSALPQASVGVPYTGPTFMASGGSGSYLWSATGLPSPLTMSAAGMITGTPTAATATPASVTVTVADASNANTPPAHASYTLTVGNGATRLAFYPVTPCRMVDTRGATGTFGGPMMTAGSTRVFPDSGGSLRDSIDGAGILVERDGSAADPR